MNDEVRTFLAEVSRSLSRFSGIHGVGLGSRITAERVLTEGSLQVFVSKKVARNALSRSMTLPTSIGGIPVDVIEQDKSQPLIDRPPPVAWRGRRSSMGVYEEVVNYSVEAFADQRLQNQHSRVWTDPINALEGGRYNGRRRDYPALDWVDEPHQVSALPRDLRVPDKINGKYHVMGGVPISAGAPGTGTASFVALTRENHPVGRDRYVLVSAAHVLVPGNLLASLRSNSSSRDVLANDFRYEASVGMPEGNDGLRACDVCADIVAHLQNDPTRERFMAVFDNYDDAALAYLVPGEVYVSPQIYAPPSEGGPRPVQGVFHFDLDITPGYDGYNSAPGSSENPPRIPPNRLADQIASRRIKVWKRGIKTGYTEGFVFSVGYSCNTATYPFMEASGAGRYLTKQSHEYARILPEEVGAGQALTVSTGSSGTVRCFCLEGDSGSLVLTRANVAAGVQANHAVGVLHSGGVIRMSSSLLVGAGEVMLIDRVLDDLKIRLWTTSSAGPEPQLVPSSGRADHHRHAPPLSGRSARRGEVDSSSECRPTHMLSATRIPAFYRELRSSRTGTYLLTFLGMHAGQIRDLIWSNQIVAISWHRMDGPRIAAAIANPVVSNRCEIIFPREIHGVSFVERLGWFADALSQHVNEDVRLHIDRVACILTQLIGCNRSQCVSRLEAMDCE